MQNKLRLIILPATILFIAGLIMPLAAQDKNSPNLLLITIDSLRPDHLGCYGYPQDTSPNIDRLAKSGVIFTQAIAQGSWTLPSMVSIATSTYPSGHRVNFWGVILSPKLTTFAELLRQQGYYNFLCSGHGNPLFEISGFERGFDQWTSNEEMLPADKVNAAALTFLEENQQKKFFLWIHYMDTHDHVLGLTRGDNDLMDASQKASSIIKYDAAINKIDKQIGLLTDKLKQLKIDQNTLIIITADHGEEMCEHGRCFTHAASLWDSLIRVPLIMVWGDKFSGLPKKNEQVQHIDLAPTICDIFKIKKPGFFKGQSLLPLIQGEKVPGRPAAGFAP